MNLVYATSFSCVHYIPGKKTPYIIYTTERRSINQIHISKEVYEDRKESYIQRIKAILDYAETDDKCRSRMLLRYFGEKNEHNCGQCDVCQGQHPSGLKFTNFSKWEERIYHSLKESPCSSSELVERFDTEDKAEILQVLSYLLAEEKINQEDSILSV